MLLTGGRVKVGFQLALVMPRDGAELPVTSHFPHDAMRRFRAEPGSSVREAKRICAMCEMRSVCLEYALNNDERFGVWGGLSEKERLSLRRSDEN